MKKTLFLAILISSSYTYTAQQTKLAKPSTEVITQQEQQAIKNVVIKGSKWAAWKTAQLGCMLMGAYLTNKVFYDLCKPCPGKTMLDRNTDSLCSSALKKLSSVLTPCIETLGGKCDEEIIRNALGGAIGGQAGLELLKHGPALLSAVKTKLKPYLPFKKTA